MTFDDIRGGNISGRTALLGLLILCCLTLLPFLGLAEFNSKGEPREAVVAFSMLQQNDWLLPVNNGGEIPYKPPFFHWLVALCGLLTGGVGEYASRLPSALALIGLTLVTYRFFLHRRGIAFALTAALLTFTAWELHRAGMNCRVDMVLTFFTVTAIFLLYRWAITKSMHGMPWLAILMMSCATLTKGPVGIIVPCLAVGIFLLARGVNFFKAFIWLALWGVMSLIIPAIWYVAAYARGGEEFLSLVLEENFGRMTNTMSYDSCVHPWPYNIGVFLAGWIPWTLAAILTLFALRRNDFRSHAESVWKRFRSMRSDTLLCVVAAVAIFVFYCIPQSKRSVYLMPCYPFVAGLLTILFHWAAERKKAIMLIFGDIMAALAVVLFIAFITLKTTDLPASLFGQGRHGAINLLTVNLIRESGVMAWVWMLFAPAAACAWWGALRKRVAANEVAASIAVIVTAIYIAIAGSAQPAALNAKSQLPLALEIEARFPGISAVSYHSNDNPQPLKLYEFISDGVFAKGDPVHFFEINFYLGNVIGNFYKDRPAEGILLLDEEDAHNFLPQFREEGYQFEQQWQSRDPRLRTQLQIYQFKIEK